MLSRKVSPFEGQNGTPADDRRPSLRMCGAATGGDAPSELGVTGIDSAGEDLLIEPGLWNAARDKAGNDDHFRATIGELLKLWLAGEVDPWQHETP